MDKQNTGDQILDIARGLLAESGIGAVSFDAIAQRLGRSKQAVLYWFPSKHDLLAAMFLPWLQAEADVATRSVSEAANRNEAVAAFVGAIARFHLDDLDRFRMMYLLPQTLKPSLEEPQNAALLEKVHEVTDRVYAALAKHLSGDRERARREAVAIHSAILGLVLMFGLADKTRDPLKHSEADMVDALINSLGSA